MHPRPTKSTRTDTLFPYTMGCRSVDDVLLFDEREAILAFDLLAHAGEDQLARPALLGNEIGDPARALRLLPNPDGLQELNAPAGEHAPRQRNRRHEFAAQGMAVLGQRRLAVRRDQVGPVAERRDGVAGIG